MKNKKTAKTNDSVELWTKFLEYMLERAKKRYNTIDEMSEDINRMFKSGMEVIQQNYDRWFEHELKPNMAMYGIELLGGEDDVVIEDNPDIVEEDPFLTDEDKESGDGIDEENFFDDEENPMDENGNPEQPMTGDENKKPFLDNNNNI